jgi:hypothetical protein
LQPDERMMFNGLYYDHKGREKSVERTIASESIHKKFQPIALRLAFKHTKCNQCKAHDKRWRAVHENQQ